MRLLLLPLSSFIISTSFSQDQIPSASPDIKTFATQSEVLGSASNSVNLFTGSVLLPINLINVTGHNGLNVDLGITYSSNVQNTVNTWNLEAPTGILGLGWSMNIPKIVVDHQQTGNRDDDEYFLLEGGATHHLIRTTSGNDGSTYYIYQTDNYQFWSIKYYYDANELTGGLPTTGSNKWVITKEDGTKYVYGENNNGRSTVQYLVRWGNWIGNSSQLTGQSQMACAWNLSEIINRWNEKITFKYDNVEQFVGSSSGKKHTEASYLSEITDMFGRKLKFFYTAKLSQFVTEPHTEQAEPDAYQEVYEKNYLDRVEIWLSSNSIYSTIQFSYKTTGEPLSKMRLSSIVQKSAAGNPLPGMSFTYNETAGPTLGYLTKIIYPTKGEVSYTYTATAITFSNREFTASAPAGYAEPKTFIGDDYVVVIWRQLGTGSTHDVAVRPIKVYAYRWIGRWVETLAITNIINTTLSTGSDAQRDYDNLQVAIEKDFFAIMVTQPSGSVTVSICNKSQNAPGGWFLYQPSASYGPGTPTLLSGNKFVAVGSFQDDTYPSNLYVYQGGNGWRGEVLNQTVGDHYYTAANNYIISQKRDATGVPRSIEFNYLSEDGKWVKKTLSSTLSYSSDQPSNWYSCSSFAQVMADDNPEYVFRWDLGYNNFYRDSKDKNNIDLFGELGDNSRVFIQNNSLIGIQSKLARFDGLGWSVKNLSTDDMTQYYYFGYGDDYLVHPTYSFSGLYGKIRSYNPNITDWQTDIDLTSDYVSTRATAGINYCLFGSDYYYRQTNGTWVSIKSFTQDPSGTYFSASNYPSHDVWFQVGTNINSTQKISVLKNGIYGTEIGFVNKRIFYKNVKFKSHGVSNKIIVSTPTSAANHFDATSVILNRMVNNEVTGVQTDYPVTLVTVWDGLKNSYTTFKYNAANATFDPEGTSGLYNEVSVIPGSSTSTYFPFGYTKTLFYNSLPETELVSFPFSSVDNRLTGTAYLVQQHNTLNAIIKSDKTEYAVYGKTLKNDLNTVLRNAFYVRPYKISSTLDGRLIEDFYSYDDENGMVSTKRTNDYYSNVNTSFETRYRYFFREYDINKTLNLLSPIIQESTYQINTPVSIKVSTWKQWGSIYNPHKTYTWKRTGTGLFDFTLPSSSEPGTDWKKTGEITDTDAIGNVVQTINP